MNIKSLKFDMAAEYGPINSRKILLRNPVLDSVLIWQDTSQISCIFQSFANHLDHSYANMESVHKHELRILRKSQAEVWFSFKSLLPWTSKISKMGQPLFKGDGDIINVSFILVHTNFFMDILYVWRFSDIFSHLCFADETRP